MANLILSTSMRALLAILSRAEW